MPKIETLSGRSTFTYTKDGRGEFFIEYTGRPHITAALINKIQSEFRGKTIPAGFSMTDPTPGGFGEWLAENTALTPRHGSHIAAVLKEMGVIAESYGKRSITLKFAR